jgi:hypothetical protein
MDLKGACRGVTQPTYLAGDPRVGGRVVVVPSPLEERSSRLRTRVRLDDELSTGGRIMMGEENGDGRGEW